MGDLLGGDFTRALDSWLAAGRIDDAAAARSRRHWFDQQLSDEASLAAMFVDLAESGKQVRLALAAAIVLPVTLATVGLDFVIAIDAHDHEHIIATRSILRVEVTNRSPPLGTTRDLAQLKLQEVLALAAEERPEVVVHDFDGSGARGELTQVGSDYLVLRVRESNYRSIVIPTSSISRLSST
ncbi:MAG: hypothetical protein V3V01_08605 [Acidimicrobiales bacterium]